MNKQLLKSQYKSNIKSTKEKYKNERKIKKTEYKAKLFAQKNDYRASIRQLYLSEGKALPKDPPKRSLLEEIGNATTHGVGAIFGIVAMILMLMLSDSVLKYAGAIVYGVGLVIMFTMSCLYHSFRHGSAVKRLFRRFDYSSIYLLIGATFAPVLLAYFGNTFGFIFFGIQWAIIALGITLVGVFGPTRLRFIHIPLYLILGWSALMLMPGMLRGAVSMALFILAGGVVYSVGIIPFALKKRCSHFIWHFFVLAGAIVQWVGIFTHLYLK